MTRSTRQQIVSGVVAVALLGGCAIGPNYTRPAVAEPPTFRGQAAVEAASFADAPWWEAFQDPSLQALILKCLPPRSEEHTSELQSRSDLVCRLLLEKKKEHTNNTCSYCVA